MTQRLSLSTLAQVPSGVTRPSYDIAGQKTGIVHLGLGAFHRAHQAAYVDDRLNAGERDWAILGASLRAPGTRDALAPQDGLYSMLVKSNADVAARVIGAVRGLLVASEDPEALLRAMSDPAIRIVSLTVTEKGYCHDPATGTLREDHPDILRDLATPQAPRTAPGLLVEALHRRRAAGAAPFTILCCDNLAHNGEVVRRVVGRLAELRDVDLGAHVAGEVAFPSTMVDRIVPATTDADRVLAARALGLADAWPVTAEPFSQWVIEDHFPLGRPHWEDSGAEIVADVAPYETMKLRLLNGAHSTLAYLGYLAGHETISDAMAVPAFARLARELMDEEVTPTLRVPLGADLARYKDQLIARFRNSALRHRTWQIAMDGSQKLPPRLLGTARDRLMAGAPFPRIALGIAAWMRYVTGQDEKGAPIDVRDPLAERLRAIADQAGPDASRLTLSLLDVREIFGDDLPADPRFVAAVREALTVLFARGAARAVEEVVRRPR